jgi:hypothetical protein
MFLGTRDTFTTAQDMAVAVGRLVRDGWRAPARLTGGGGCAPDGGSRPRTDTRGRPQRRKATPAATPRRTAEARAAPDFRTGFAARRSRGEMVDTEDEIYCAGTPQDVTSVRAKTQRHRKSTADRWNQ